MLPLCERIRLESDKLSKLLEDDWPGMWAEMRGLGFILTGGVPNLVADDES